MTRSAPARSTRFGGSSSILQDVELTYLSDYADVSIGQFKIPISYEGYNSASKLIFPERALVMTGPDGTVLWSHQADSPGDLPGANLIFDALDAAAV